jgi:hypothetical protein
MPEKAFLVVAFLVLPKAYINWRAGKFENSLSKRTFIL